MKPLSKILKPHIKKYPRLDVYLRLLKRKYIANTTGYPNWNAVLQSDQLQWTDALQRCDGGSNILLATSVGAHLPGTTVESLLGVALTVRAAKVHVLLCDAALTACMDCVTSWFPQQEAFVEHGPSKDLCASCFPPAYEMFQSLGLPVYRYSEFISEANKNFAAEISSSLPFSEIPNYSYEGIAVGEHAHAGALRFFARGSLDGEPYAEEGLRRYLHAAILTTCVARTLFRQVPFECVTLHHGIYVPQGLIAEVARQEKIRVVTWNPAYRKQCFIFSHQDTYHHTLLSEPVSNWENIRWTSAKETRLMDYLQSRKTGAEDWIWFHEDPIEDLAKFQKDFNIDFTKPCIGLLTNVLWDAQLHYPANAFPDMLTWLLETIAYFCYRSDLQLIIRVHPAEIRGTVPSRQHVYQEIMKVFPSLPANIWVVPPESSISTYALMEKCQNVIIYGTKMGVEIASRGIPVIVAGEAWIRNKGISHDAETREQYFGLLEKLPFPDLDEATVIRARKYAYHFFFRRMLPLECMKILTGQPAFQVKLDRLSDIAPGQSKGLDLICNGILSGTEFVCPAE